MNFIIIFGPPAVGKMSVGLEIERLTGIKLFHNHLTIEPVLRLFEFGTPPFRRLVHSFRQQTFEEVAKSDLPGFLFTFVWDLDAESDKAFILDTIAIFEAENADIALVELKADLDVRLIRNKLPDRLEAKPSKRNVESSEKNLLTLESGHRLNSDQGIIDFPYKHVSIDTTNLDVRETAELVIEKLGLPHKNA